MILTVNLYIILIVNMSSMLSWIKRYYQCITWRHGVYTKVEGRENLSRVENKVKVLKICLEVRTPLPKKLLLE